MAKTYTAAGSATAGAVYTASAHNVIVTNVNNFIVPPACRAARTAVQSINNSTWTFVSFTSETYDTDGMFAATDTKITIQTAGLYSVSCLVSFATNATGIRAVQIEKNAPTANNGTVLIRNVGFGNASEDVWFNLSSVFEFAASDTVHVSVLQTSGGALNAGSAVVYPFLTATWIGRTS